MNKKYNDFYLFVIKNRFTIYIIILILLFIILINNLYKQYSHYESFFIPKKYFRCDTRKLGTINNEIFEEHQIKKDNINWDIYVPCGYNHVEKELLNIQLPKHETHKYIYGINGCDNIVSKNKIWESLVSCYGRLEASKYMPESYVLHNSNDMNNFKLRFNKKKIYILKKNVQRKEGLKLTSNLKIIMDSVLDNYKVVQIYLTDLFLINQYKVNLRIYLFIQIKNNIKTFYVSHLGKCIYTNKKYNHNNYDFSSNITSYNLDMNIYKKNPRNLVELYDYVNKHSNYNNASQILSNNIHKLMEKVSRCISNTVYQSKNLHNTTCFQLFGADVIFDNQLHPYLLEFNKGPDMIPRDDIDKSMKKKVQEDMFKIVGLIPNTYKENNSFFEVYRSTL